MNYGAGAQVATVVDVRNRIMDNPDQSVLNKIQDLAEINRGLYSSDSRTPSLGSLLHTAMNAALGVGIARGIGAVLDLGSSFQNKLETAAMGIGLLKSSQEQADPDINYELARYAVWRHEHAKQPRKSGVLARYTPADMKGDKDLGEFKKWKDAETAKTAESIDSQRKAFRIAFVKAAYDAGYFDKAAAPVLVEADDIKLSPGIAYHKALGRAQAAGLKPDQSTFDEIVRQYKAHGGDVGSSADLAPLIGSVGGEALGGAVGAMVGGEGNRLFPGIAGASMGGVVGLGAGLLLRHIKKKQQAKTAAIGFSAVSLSPGMLLSVPQAASNALMLGGRTTGATLGALDAPTSEDEQEAQMEATRDLLRQRLAQAKALKAETSLRSLLAKRRH